MISFYSTLSTICSIIRECDDAGDQQNLRIRKKYSRSRPHLNHPFNQQATIGFLQMFVMVFFIN